MSVTVSLPLVTSTLFIVERYNDENYCFGEITRFIGSGFITKLNGDGIDHIYVW